MTPLDIIRDSGRGPSLNTAGGERLAIAATSAASTLVGSRTVREVLLHATVACYVNVAPLDAGPADPTADAAGKGVPLGVGEKIRLRIQPGEKVAVIRASADGFLFIIPVRG